MTRRRLLYAGGIVLLVAAWAAFRPEKLFVNQTVNEAFPVASNSSPKGEPSSPKPLFMGKFQSLSHDTEGSAAVYELPDGKRVLRFTEFATSNGPDVRVYMVEGADGAYDARIKRGGFVSLGSLKGNRGDQNYELPADLNLETHRAVSIWCARFGVNFAAASLASRATINK